MAYDKKRYDEIQSMKLGELVHVMLTEYGPAQDKGAYMQSNEYLWALERLNELTPKDAEK